MAQIVKKTTVARGLTLDGRPFSIHKLAHDAEVPGVGKETYSVDVAGSDTATGTATGFASYADAKRYVTGGKDKFDTFDGQGNKQTVEREGLYVPAGAIWEAADAQPKKSSSQASGSSSDSGNPATTPVPGSQTPTPGSEGSDEK